LGFFKQDADVVFLQETKLDLPQLIVTVHEIKPHSVFKHGSATIFSLKWSNIKEIAKKIFIILKL